MDMQKQTSSYCTGYKDDTEEPKCTLCIKQEPGDNKPCEVKEEKISPWEAETGYITIKPETLTETFTSGGEDKDDMKTFMEGVNIDMIKCEESTQSYEVAVKASDEVKSPFPVVEEEQHNVVTGQSYEDEQNVNEDRISHKCNICSQEFTRFVAIEDHMISHVGENPCRCDTCGEVFPQPDELKNHLMIHMTKVPYKCNVCEKKFTYKCQLEAHINVHIGETPYRCDICGKSLCHYSALINHRRIHTGDKPFKCDICQKKYISNHFCQ